MRSSRPGCIAIRFRRFRLRVWCDASRGQLVAANGFGRGGRCLGAGDIRCRCRHQYQQNHADSSRVARCCKRPSRERATSPTPASVSRPIPMAPWRPWPTGRLLREHGAAYGSVSGLQATASTIFRRWRDLRLQQRRLAVCRQTDPRHRDPATIRFGAVVGTFVANRPGRLVSRWLWRRLHRAPGGQTSMSPSTIPSRATTRELLADVRDGCRPMCCEPRRAGGWSLLHEFNTGATKKWRTTPTAPARVSGGRGPRRAPAS